METDTPPVNYPVVNIGGRPYAVKFGIGAAYRLEQQGLRLSQIKQDIVAEVEAGRKLSLIIKLGAAALGTPGATWAALGLSPEQLADTLLDGEFDPLCKAVMDSLLKRSRPAANGSTPATGEQGPSQ